MWSNTSQLMKAFNRFVWNTRRLLANLYLELCEECAKEQITHNKQHKPSTNNINLQQTT